ncbi:hypothetical protein [Alcanivorax sp. 1008]|uniref:hypothetical protein n=1 Tax=Alcanivorax sp. 1008 TaxID=2816853 RepID=UPI001D949E7D|nr:hypothetical protein [Alcanivorax sp. 1008]MCC1497927.1 hypothetical protein [Alcanivorax sp. 1008]
MNPTAPTARIPFLSLQKATITVRLPLICSLLLSLTGCMVVTDSSAPYGRVGIAPPAPDVNLALWQPPERLDSYVLQGSLQGSEHDLRLFRYINPATLDETLEMAVYPIPGGWEDLPPLRMVEGHFPQQREIELRRLQRHSRADVEETIHDSLSDPALKYPLAISEMHVLGNGQSLSSLLILTADMPVFIRLRLESKQPDIGSRIEEMRQTLLLFRDGLVRHAGP